MSCCESLRIDYNSKGYSPSFITVWISYKRIPLIEILCFFLIDSIGGSSSEEQQYHDDLQAGAFQFVDATGSRDDLPLTYQVMFWAAQSNTPTMAWKYPQPRVITKFCLLPIPFRVSNELSKFLGFFHCNIYCSECVNEKRVLFTFIWEKICIH